MEKILPVVYPPITTYPGIAQPLSILFCNKEHIMPWFIPRYIQLATFTDKSQLDKGISMVNFLDGMCNKFGNNIKDYKLPRDLIDIKWGDFTEFLRDCLNNNYYILLSLNMYFFPCSPKYHEKQFMHFPMIYGYSDELKMFYVADFYKNSVYSFEKVPYCEMNQAYVSASFGDLNKGQMFDYLYYVSLWKYNPDVKFQFHLEEFNSIMEDYIQGKDSTQYLVNSPCFKEIYYYYGIDYYEAISYNFKNKYYDMRALHLLCDHKKAFLLKIEYLFLNEYLTSIQYERLKKKCELIYHSSIINRNLFIKCKIAKSDESYIERVIKNLSEMKENDLDFCNDLLCVLQ